MIDMAFDLFGAIGDAGRAIFNNVVAPIQGAFIHTVSPSADVAFQQAVSSPQAQSFVGTAFTAAGLSSAAVAGGVVLAPAVAAALPALAGAVKVAVPTLADRLPDVLPTVLPTVTAHLTPAELNPIPEDVGLDELDFEPSGFDE